LKYVSYIAVEGLANRLRTHLAAQAYALHTGRKLLVNWSIVKAFGVHYSDLFEMDGCTELGKSRLEYLDWSMRDLRTLRLNGRQRINGVKDLPNPRFGNVLLGEAFSPWVYESEGRMMDGYRDRAVSMLRPRTETFSVIEDFASKLGNSAVGLHIRRGDFAISFPETQREPQAYAALFDLVVERFPRRLIYIATDDADFVIDALGPRTYLIQGKKPRSSDVSADEIFGYPNKCNRDTLQGAREATVDLFTLARCGVVISEFKSSFGRMAAFIGNSEFVSISEILSEGVELT
jgi:hypothetical protein